MNFKNIITRRKVTYSRILVISSVKACKIMLFLVYTKKVSRDKERGKRSVDTFGGRGFEQRKKQEPRA